MTAIAYKLTLLLTARDGLSPDDLADAWLELEEREPLRAAGLVAHTFNRLLPVPSPITGVPPAPFHAAVETWWQRKNDAASWVVSPEFDEGWLPDRLALLAGPPAAVGGAPELAWGRELPESASPVRVLALPVALRRLRFAEFVDHWTTEHTRLALEGPLAKDRLVSLEYTPAPIPPPGQFARTRYDGIAAVTFESADALAAEFGSDYYEQVLAPDERRFTDTAFSAVLVTEPVALS